MKYGIVFKRHIFGNERVLRGSSYFLSVDLQKNDYFSNWTKHSHYSEKVLRNFFGWNIKTITPEHLDSLKYLQSEELGFEPQR